TACLSAGPAVLPFHCYAVLRALHSFPTRRSSDLFFALTSLIFSTLPASAESTEETSPEPEVMGFVEWVVMGETGIRLKARLDTGDRKSTRLNSSHVKISYAVFCLKKKKKTLPTTT